MPAGPLVHVAVFAAGAVIGGGVATVISGNKQKNAVPIEPPIMDISPRGVPHFPPTAPSISSILKYGNPGPIADPLVRTAYVAAYDRRLRHPAWTAEHLTLTSLGKSNTKSVSDGERPDRSRSAFQEDKSLPSQFRAKISDYFKSGYDRGHMVPAADAKTSQAAMDETFLLSNIAPQVGQGFNRNYWAYLEEWCRRLPGSFADVYVFTIPLYLPKEDADGKWRIHHEVIGSPPNVSVPTHFAKVVLTSKPTSPSTPDVLEVNTGAFVLPNAIIPDATPLTSFIVPVDAVERAAGLILFSDAVKAGSKHICQSTKCELVVRHFDDAQKKGRKAIGAPK